MMTQTSEPRLEFPPPPQVVADLANDGSLYYLATPYTRAPGGHDLAYRIACGTAANLMALGVAVFCPIAHGHSIVLAGPFQGRGDVDWQHINNKLLSACDGMIVAMTPGWSESAGVAEEIWKADELILPVYYMLPDGTLLAERPEPVQ